MKWRIDEVEWFYYRQLVHLPLAESMGPDKPIFGYLPGCKALLAPFVLTEPAGFVVFAAVNALACVALYVFVHRRFTRFAGSFVPDHVCSLWLSICFAVPSWFVLQNNQIVAPSMLLAVLAFLLIERRREISGGALFAGAALIKTLPLALLLFPLAGLRWKVLGSTATSLAILSLGLATLTDGFSESVQSHLRWPSQVSAQNAMSAVVADSEPQSFYSNQSASAEIVRLARTTGFNEIIWLHPFLVLSSVAVLLAVSTRPTRYGLYWLRVGGWLAWVAFAAPFGRYYYLLYLVPALYVLGLRALAYSGRKRNLCLVILTVASLLLLVARSHNAMYAVASFSMLTVYLVVLVVEVMRAEDIDAGAGVPVASD